VRAREFSNSTGSTTCRLVLLALICCSALAQTSIKGLNSAGPDPTLAEKLKLFGQFVGDWKFDLISIQLDARRLKGGGEWHFGWVLDGRAVQDVWVARDDVSNPNGVISEWGTTLRCYDPKSDAWRVVWVGPKRGIVMAFVAKQSADEIVMEVDYVQGLPHVNPSSGPPIHRGQWIFDQIKPDSFHWRSVTSRDGGKDWAVDQEMFVRRVRVEATSKNGVTQFKKILDLQSTLSGTACHG
jgi:hypothetical protein